VPDCVPRPVWPDDQVERLASLSVAPSANGAWWMLSGALVGLVLVILSLIGDRRLYVRLDSSGPVFYPGTVLA